MSLAEFKIENPYSLFSESPSNCSSSFCVDKTPCVGREQFCDGKVDCNDRTDESHCGKNALQLYRAPNIYRQTEKGQKNETNITVAKIDNVTIFFCH